MVPLVSWELLISTGLTHDFVYEYSQQRTCDSPFQMISAGRDRLAFCRPLKYLDRTLGRSRLVNNCCKEWALKVIPRQTCPANQTGFEEAHACPVCQGTYLLWFTCIGDSQNCNVQTVPLTIKPAKELVESAAYMQQNQDSLTSVTQR